MTVSFIDVGRDQKSWTIGAESAADHTLIQSIREHNALASRGIEFAWNDDGDAADIVVGGFRVVGRVELHGGIRL